ncbi:hypothetical protein BD413DRAFT_594308 [Trametes elegans]|nr:hypothetical protein BD413DRAFT_594308 [Trametes elegans]
MDSEFKSESFVAAANRVRAVEPRSLVDFSDPRELAQIMLGAIHAHRRLYEDANILHGDVSPNTILIFDGLSTGTQTGQTAGAIIDFDKPNK